MNPVYAMKAVIFHMLLVLMPAPVMAQLNAPAYIPTPNTTAISRYGVIPMSLYTGKANISVPVFSSTLRGITLNASLVYDTSGILINTLPSWTGTSWTLEVGGVITRAVKGYPDEYDQTNNHIGQYWENYFHRYKGNINDSKEGYGDYMPDIFYFHFMGKSGKFFLGNDGNWKVASDDNLMVEFDIDDKTNYTRPFIEYLPSGRLRHPYSIKGFTIIDQEGNRYVFGGSQGQNASEYSINLLHDNDGNAEAEMYANSWYLTAVYDRLGNKVFTFEYERGLFLISAALCYSEEMPVMTINSPVYLSRITARDGSVVDFVRDTRILTSTDFYYRLYNKYGGNVEKLYRALVNLQEGSSINSCFIYLTSDKYSKYQNPGNDNKKKDPLRSMGLSPLKEIRISSAGGTYKRYTLDYNSDSKTRLRLLSVGITDKSGTRIGKYDFKYSGIDKLPTISDHPDYLAAGSDHWGYYNGMVSANSYEDKAVNAKFCKYGMLTEIIYPTGGITVIEYDNNWYDSYRNVYHDGMTPVYADADSKGATSKIAGGLRVRSLNSYEDSTKRKLLTWSTYSYEGGQLTAKPVYKTVYSASYAPIFSGYSAVPMANTFGYHIGYSKVTETEGYGDDNENQNIYEYSNFSNYKDDSCWEELVKNKTNGNAAARLAEKAAAFDEWTERDFRRGKLLRLTAANYDDTPWSVTEYKYRQDSVRMESEYVVGYMDKSRASYSEHYGNSLAKYKLFYNKYDIVGKTEAVRCNTTVPEFVHTSTTYNMTDRIVTVGNDKANLRLCASEKTSRESQKVIKCFSYIHDGYFTPLTFISEYNNGILNKRHQTVYQKFDINSQSSLLPAYSIVVSPAGVSDTVMVYKSYTSTGLPSEYTDENGMTVRLQWDNNDRLLSYTHGSLTTTCEYTDGLPTIITQPSGVQTQYGYDNLRRLSEILDGNGNTRQRFGYGYRNR